MNGKLQGIIPPIITPLAEPDRLDRPALAQLIERLIAGGVSGIFALGTTGEGPVLSNRLQRDVVAAICEIARGRVPVLIGVTSTSPVDSLSLAEHAQRCGADAIVAAPLMYFSPRPSDVTAYFTRLAEASPLPLILYDMPACVRTELPFETAAACTRLPQVIGVKDSSGDLRRFERLLLLKSVRPDWTFLIGPELLTSAAVLAGGHGAVAGGANVEPELFVELYRAACVRDTASTERLLARARRLNRLYALSDDSMNVVRGVKVALALRGHCTELLASPYAAPSDDQFRAKAAGILASLIEPAGVAPVMAAATVKPVAIDGALR